MRAIFETTPAIDHRDGGNRLAVWYPDPHVALSRIEGTLTVELADRFSAAMDPVIARGRFVGLHDWTRMGSFDVLAPPKLTAWTVRNLAQISRIVIATEHPLVSMAVRAANLTIRKVEHVGSFEALLTAAAKAPG